MEIILTLLRPLSLSSTHFHTFSPIRRGSHLQMSDYIPLIATTGNSRHTIDDCYEDHMAPLSIHVTLSSSSLFLSAFINGF